MGAPACALASVNLLLLSPPTGAQTLGWQEEAEPQRRWTPRA